MANLYKNQGKPEEAEVQFTRAPEGQEKLLGLGHAATLNTLNNPGVLLSDQDQLDETKQMYLQALTGYEGMAGHIAYIIEQLSLLGGTDGEIMPLAFGITMATKFCLTMLNKRSRKRSRGQMRTMRCPTLTQLEEELATRTQVLQVYVGITFECLTGAAS